MYVAIYSSSKIICQAMKREDRSQVIDPQEENYISFSCSEKTHVHKALAGFFSIKVRP